MQIIYLCILSMSDIKQIQVTGDALLSLMNNKRSRGGAKRKTRKVSGLPDRSEEILENESTPISPIHFIKHDTHSLPINKESKESKEQKESNEPKKSNESKEIKEIILPNDNIIKENIKIVLAPKKKKEHRVILSRKRKQINNINITGGFKNKTRKVSFNLLKHKKRLTRAKKIFDQSNKLSIDRIKKELINKNIIKSTSKAPESILRQIYNDALIVANKAL